MIDSLGFPIETKLKNGIRIVTYKKAHREFESAAIFDKKLLNLRVMTTPIEASKHHDLLVKTWEAAAVDECGRYDAGAKKS